MNDTSGKPDVETAKERLRDALKYITEGIKTDNLPYAIAGSKAHIKWALRALGEESK